MASPSIPPESVPAPEAASRDARGVEAVVRLVGGVAHDFNNLLTVIGANAQHLTQELPADSALRREAGEIAEAARRAATLTHQLLAFSRQLVMQPRHGRLTDLVADAWPQLQRLITPGVELRRLPDTSSALAWVDPALLTQALGHLVQNAVEAMPHGGTVAVGVRDVYLDSGFAAEHRPMTPGHYVLLEVSDNGVGMAADVLGRALEPFFTTKGQKHGTGMGLAAVYGIVKQSGGFIWLDSRVSFGTTCRIYLPRAPERESSPRVRTPSPIPRPEGLFTILVVEDEDLVRMLAKRTLERAGYRVVDAPNGHVALDLVREGNVQPDLLLTDIVMPGIDGRDLAATLETECPGMGVILMSGFVDRREANVIASTRWPFLPKPFSLDDLRSKVRETLPVER
jgi:CheY-like chemotaxis protein